MPMEAVSGIAIAMLGVLMSLLLLPNAVLAAGAAGLRLWSALNASPNSQRSPLAHGLLPVRAHAGELPFISVHVPAHDEPADILIATLDALAQLDYPSFEVIILDNNTPDPATWQPVAAHARALGERFRFVHRDGVKGAKAGALNIALGLTDHRAHHVAVVDADYAVKPEFLRVAMDALAASGADYAQFPQAYRHGASAAPVARELDDYFRSSATAANRTRSMLLTGTLCVLSIDRLIAVGGWPTGTITEDADLGLALYASGATGLFCDQVVGHGLLPVDYSGLSLQRDRWVAGNMQTLLRAVRLMSAGFREKGLLRGYLPVLAQLLAWPAFLAIPVVALLAAAVVRLAGHPGSSWLLAETLAASTLLLSASALVIEQMIVKNRPDTVPVKIAMVWTASLAWLPLLWGRQFRFRRTPKVSSGPAPLPAMMVVGGSVLVLAALVLAATGAPIAAASLLLPIASVPASAWVARRLSCPGADPAGGDNPCTA